MAKTVSVILDGGITYVSGIVNGVEHTFALTSDNTWSAEVDASDDNIYRLALTAIDSNGSVTTLSTVLYYGINLITDRTQLDVARYLELKEKDFSDMTEEEKIEWLSDMKGAYNAMDMSRVDGAVNYLVNRLREYGYHVDGVNTFKMWSYGYMPKLIDLVQYLNNIRIMRSAFAILDSTPSVPDDMRYFTYEKANHIEQILVDIDFLLTNMIQTWYYAEDIYSGEV